MSMQIYFVSWYAQQWSAKYMEIKTMKRRFIQIFQSNRFIEMITCTFDVRRSTNTSELSIDFFSRLIWILLFVSLCLLSHVAHFFSANSDNSICWKIMNSWRRYARYSERRMQFSTKSFIQVSICNFVRLSFHQIEFRQSISDCIYLLISANTYHLDNRYYYLFAVIFTESSLYFIPHAIRHAQCIYIIHVGICMSYQYITEKKWLLFRAVYKF